MDVSWFKSKLGSISLELKDIILKKAVPVSSKNQETSRSDATSNQSKHHGGNDSSKQSGSRFQVSDHQEHDMEVDKMTYINMEETRLKLEQTAPDSVAEVEQQDVVALGSETPVVNKENIPCDPELLKEDMVTNEVETTISLGKDIQVNIETNSRANPILNKPQNVSYFTSNVLSEVRFPLAPNSKFPNVRGNKIKKGFSKKP